MTNKLFIDDCVKLADQVREENWSYEFNPDQNFKETYKADLRIIDGLAVNIEIYHWTGKIDPRSSAGSRMEAHGIRVIDKKTSTYLSPAKIGDYTLIIEDGVFIRGNSEEPISKLWSRIEDKVLKDKLRNVRDYLKEIIEE
jgi:hypothetical protein